MSRSIVSRALRGEPLASARAELEIARGGLRAAKAAGDGQYEQAQWLAAIMRIEDEIASLTPSKRRAGGVR